MKPIEFDEQTKVLQKPGSMTHEECGPLPVFCDEIQCISLWRPTFKERLKLLFFGRIWVGILSRNTQPPIWVDVNKTVFHKNKVVD